MPDVARHRATDSATIAPATPTIHRPAVSRTARSAIQSPQQTIRETAAVEGFGYWSGKDVRIEFRPAEPDTGVVFVRHDLDPAIRIPATVAHRIETPRRTTLTHHGATVEMVEHVLAALAGLEVDNCEIWTNGSEMPGCEGSSQPFVDALDRAVIVPQNAPSREIVIQEITRLGNDDHWIEARPASPGELRLRYRLEYSEAPAIGRQTVQYSVTPEVFRRELASSRTFMLQEEAQWLLDQGLGKRVRPTDVLVFDEEGPIENELRFPDECARHKALDLLGDLSLAGCRLVGHFVAHRSGHRLNAELVRVLLTENEIQTARRRSA